MKYREEIAAHYTGIDGAIHGVKNPVEAKTSGNHHVMMATHLNIIIALEGRPALGDFYQYKNYIEACRHSLGIFHRAPGYPDRQTHDDLLAIAISSRFLALPFAREIYERGTKWRRFKWFWCPWYFDNEDKKDFEVRKFFGRFFWFQAVVKASACVELSFVDKLAYSIYLLMGARKSRVADTSGKQLRWITLRVMRETDSALINWAAKVYSNSIRKNYTGGMRGAFAIYYGKEHPFARDWFVGEM
jgi:hypothetical protein